MLGPFPKMPLNVDDDGTVRQPGLSYVCPTCQVYGYLQAGERCACWCCGTASVARR